MTSESPRSLVTATVTFLPEVPPLLTAERIECSECRKTRSAGLPSYKDSLQAKAASFLRRRMGAVRPAPRRGVGGKIPESLLEGSKSAS